MVTGVKMQYSLQFCCICEQVKCLRVAKRLYGGNIKIFLREMTALSRVVGKIVPANLTETLKIKFSACMILATQNPLIDGIQPVQCHLSVVFRKTSSKFVELVHNLSSPLSR